MRKKETKLIVNCELWKGSKYLNTEEITHISGGSNNLIVLTHFERRRISNARLVRDHRRLVWVVRWKIRWGCEQKITQTIINHKGVFIHRRKKIFRWTQLSFLIWWHIWQTVNQNKSDAIHSAVPERPRVLQCTAQRSIEEGMIVQIDPYTWSPNDQRYQLQVICGDLGSLSNILIPIRNQK